MRARQFRSVFISDVHLGTPDCRADYLLDFLRSTDCERLYLVGDIIDLEALSTRAWWHPTHTLILAELLRKAATGTHVIYIPGNHDATMRGLAGQRIGPIDVRLDAIHETADGRRFHVSHGDEFDAHSIGERWLKWFGIHAHRWICRANRGVNTLRRRVRLPYLPLTILLKSRIRRASRYISDYEQSVATDARERQLDGHICGHIHYGNVREIDGVLYCNDGDWVEHCTALVEQNDGTLELLHWSERRTTIAQAPTRVPVPAFVLAMVEAN
jgi:UDP-2,3-diacylglucosamine pyrophosphatase LpxH